MADLAPHSTTVSVKEQEPSLPRYRPALDGLRAIAVFSVLFYHLGYRWMGGFLGDDISFVLSPPSWHHERDIPGKLHVPKRLLPS